MTFLLHDNSYQDEKKLLQLMAEGNKYAFEKIYNQYSDRLYSNLLRLVKSEVLAQELLQDTFIRIWDHRQKIDLEQSFPAYLFSIAQNLVYDFFRKTASDKKLRDELLATASIHYEHIEEDIFKREDLAFLNEVIETLPPQRRQVFRLCKLEGKSYIEVGKILGISTSTISDHIVKSTRYIKQKFIDYRL